MSRLSVIVVFLLCLGCPVQDKPSLAAVGPISAARSNARAFSDGV